MPRPPPRSMWRERRGRRPRRARPGRAGDRARRGTGSASTICEPMWQSMPTTSRPGRRAARAICGQRLGVGDAELVAAQAGRDVGMGLGVDVGIDAQADPRACGRRRARPRDSSSSSPTLSTLKHSTPASSARAISARVLPTPEKTIRAGSPPAARTRSSSPPETMSKPQPLAREPLQHRQVRVGLDRVADQVVAAGERALVRAPARAPSRRSNRRRAACRSGAPGRRRASSSTIERAVAVGDVRRAGQAPSARAGCRRQARRER